MTEKKYAIMFTTFLDDNNGVGWTGKEIQEKQNIKKKEVPSNYVGGADAILICWIIEDKDGWTSHQACFVDGRTMKYHKETEIFKLLTMYANQLKDSNNLFEWQKIALNNFFEEVRSNLLNTSKRNED
jgi:hypothetical protein